MVVMTWPRFLDEELKKQHIRDCQDAYKKAHAYTKGMLSSMGIDDEVQVDKIAMKLVTQDTRINRRQLR